PAQRVGAAAIAGMPLSIDTRRALRSRADLAALVEAVRAAPTTEQETDSVALKSSFDLRSNTADLSATAKLILGFSNPPPRRAASAINLSLDFLHGVPTLRSYTAEPEERAVWLRGEEQRLRRREVRREAGAWPMPTISLETRSRDDYDREVETYLGRAGDRW